MIKAAKAEALIRRVLAQTPPGLFQHMMRTINSQVGTQGAGRQHAAGWLGQRSWQLCWCYLLPVAAAATNCHQPRMLPSTAATCVLSPPNNPTTANDTPACPSAGAGAAGHAAHRLRGSGPAHHVPAGAVVSWQAGGWGCWHGRLRAEVTDRRCWVQHCHDDLVSWALQGVGLPPGCADATTALPLAIAATHRWWTA